MKIRQANQSDTLFLVELVFSSAPTAISAIFDINHQFSALSFLQSCLSTGQGQYGFENHWVVDIDNQVVGCFSPLYSDLPDSFHLATLAKLTGFYGLNHSIPVAQASQVLQDCMHKPKNYEMCIAHFAVLPQFQRQGVATALLNFAHKQALDLGKTILCLDVESTNSSAIKFYLKQGFVQEYESDISSRMKVLGIGKHLHLSKKLI